MYKCREVSFVLSYCFYHDWFVVDDDCFYYYAKAIYFDNLITSYANIWLKKGTMLDIVLIFNIILTF